MVHVHFHRQPFRKKFNTVINTRPSRRVIEELNTPVRVWLLFCRLLTRLVVIFVPLWSKRLTNIWTVSHSTSACCVHSYCSLHVSVVMARWFQSTFFTPRRISCLVSSAYGRGDTTNLLSFIRWRVFSVPSCIVIYQYRHITTRSVHDPFPKGVFYDLLHHYPYLSWQHSIREWPSSSIYLCVYLYDLAYIASFSTLWP